MRDKFWGKLLKKDNRSFKWFFDKYLKHRDIDLAYNTLYQQAKGDFLRDMHKELKAAISEYLEEQ